MGSRGPECFASSCSCMTARTWPASVVRHWDLQGESLFDFLRSPFFYYFRGNQVLLQFLSNELALSCDDFVFYFNRSLCRSVTDFNCVTADSEKTMHCRKESRCLTFFFLLL